jgi:tricorn protease-like protein
MSRHVFNCLRGGLVIGVLAALTVLLRQGALAGDEPVEKVALPDKEALAKAEKLINGLFKEDLEKLKDEPASGKELATTILKEGKETKEDAALRFAAFNLARDVAIKAGDHALALEAIEELARGFVVDTLPMKAEALKAAAKTTEGKEANIALAEAALQILEEAVHSDSYEAALTLAETASKAATTAKVLSLASRAKKATEDIQATQKEFERVKPFLAKLEKEKDDKEANTEAGKYYCFFKGNFAKGLPYLTKGSDADLKALADKELAKPKTSKKKRELAEAWDALGEKDKGPGRKQLLRRAYHWYAEAAEDTEGLTGIHRVKVERRMEEILKEFPTGPTMAMGNISVELRRFDGNQPSGEVVAISPDGKLALTGGAGDTVVRLWDIKTGKLLKNLNGHFGAVYAVGFSPDSKFGVSGGNDNTDRIWDLNNGQQLRTIQQHFNWVRGVGYTAGGKQIVSGSYDQTIRFFDVNNGAQTRIINGAHTNIINQMAFTKDGNKAISSSNDLMAKVWDLKNGTEITRFTGHNRTVWAVALTPDGKTAASSSYDGTIRLWDAKTGKELRKLDNKDRMAWSLAFSPDGRRLLSGHGGFCQNGFVNAGGDTAVRLWDVSSGKELRKIDGHTNYVKGLAFSPDGRLAVSVSTDGTIRVWGSK